MVGSDVLVDLVDNQHDQCAGYHLGNDWDHTRQAPNEKRLQEVHCVPHVAGCYIFLVLFCELLG